MQNQIAAIPPVADDPALSAAVKKFLTAMNSAGGPPLETLPLKDARAVLADAQASVSFDYSGVEFSEKMITADGFTIKLNIVRPAGNKDRLPAFIFIHGGGWTLGDFPTHKRMLRDLVELSGTAGMFVNYTPSPEAQYPQPLNEIFAATKWVAAHGDEINIDGSRLAIVGNSAGGNMAAVTALKAKENKGPEIKLQVLMWPLVDANFEHESYKRFGQDRFLTPAIIKWSFDSYCKDLAEREQIYVSPLNASPEQLKGLPTALIQLAESDILRDGGEAYGRKLDEAGVVVTTIRYNGTIHDFGMLNALADIPQTRSLFVHAAAELKKVFEGVMLCGLTTKEVAGSSRLTTKATMPWPIIPQNQILICACRGGVEKVFEVEIALWSDD